uniref:Uncharacterized protein n=1 Tax=Pararge aegeria TaxID=116150 RepID=S4NRU9_9NEOP
MVFIIFMEKHIADSCIKSVLYDWLKYVRQPSTMTSYILFGRPEVCSLISLNSNSMALTEIIWFANFAYFCCASVCHASTFFCETKNSIYISTF